MSVPEHSLSGCPAPARAGERARHNMLIEAIDLEKSYGATPAVRGVSIRATRGELIGVLGPNGAGKSTTLRMLAGTLVPDRGCVRISGVDAAKQPDEARDRIGYLPEAAHGFGELAVAEFLVFAAEAHGLWGAARDDAVRRVVDTLALASVASRPLASLSKGWRQRAWLGQAILHDPAVLILDEPTDGLDPVQKVALRGLLQTLARDKAIVMSTHSFEEAEALCSRVIIIADGRIVAHQETRRLLDEHGRLAPAFLRLTGLEPTRDRAGVGG